VDYPRAEFGDFSFSRFGFIVRTDRITEADQRYTHATTVGVSNKTIQTEVRSAALICISLVSVR